MVAGGTVGKTHEALKWAERKYEATAARSLPEPPSGAEIPGGEVLHHVYADYFGLTENPFSLTPDPRYLFLSSYHKEALEHLLYGINERRGFVAMIGEIGAGKTTLCRVLLNQLDDATRTAFVFNTLISKGELLQTINREFGIDTGGTRKDQVERLNDFLLENFRQGGNAVLLVDEAQNLSPVVLEQIRMLSNLETEREKLIQIVLVGQPELGKLLAQPALRQLNDRITVRYHLKLLDREDVKGYVLHRLAAAGNPGDVRFRKGALRAIYAFSRGNPRLINAVCDRSLLIAYSEDRFSVTKNTLLKAIDDIGSDFKWQYRAQPWWFRKKFAGAVAVMLLTFVVARIWGLKLKEHLSGPFSQTAKVAVIEGNTFVRKPVQLPSPPMIQDNPNVKQAFESQEEPANLILDGRSSLAGLFQLFDVERAETSLATGRIVPSLISFTGNREVYRRFQKPFRLRIRSETGDQDRYLLIKEVTTGGAIVLDAEGKEQRLTEDFILTHSEDEMSWVYPYEYGVRDLNKGMRGPSVLRLQQILQQLGYAIKATGLYNRQTFEKVVRFQQDIGLEDDGIIGPQTKALLYQLSDWNGTIETIALKSS
jgi:general secretion pathway protein A